MKWIAQEGKSLMDLQNNAAAIGEGICADLDMQLLKIGLTVSQFKISSFSYPKGVQDQINQAAAQSVIQPTGSFCTQCGAPLQPGARFCAKCGKKV